MAKRNKSNSFFKMFFSLGIIIVGTVLLLSNLGLADIEVDYWWPLTYSVFFIALGLYLLIKAFQGMNGFGTALFLMVFGVLLILGQFNYIDFEFLDIYQLWPLVLIFMGFSLLGVTTRLKRKFKRSGSTYYHDRSDDDFDSDVDINTFIGETNYGSSNWKVKPTQMWMAFGDHFMDFTKAHIPDEDTPIVIEGIAGDIKMIIPEDVAFKAKARLNAGDIKIAGQTAEGINRKLSYETDDYALATRKLTIELVLKAGSIRIDRV